MEAHCRPARPYNVLCAETWTRRSGSRETRLQPKSSRRTGRSCTALHLRRPCKNYHLHPRADNRSLRASRAPAATALHCRLAQVYSRRHAGPRAFIDDVRESAVVSAHSRQSKILVARGCSTLDGARARRDAPAGACCRPAPPAAQRRAPGRPQATHNALRQPRGNRRRISDGVAP